MWRQNICILAVLLTSIFLVGCAEAPISEPPAEDSDQVERRLSSAPPKPGSRRILRNVPTATPDITQPNRKQREPLRRPTPTPSLREIAVPKATAVPVSPRRRPFLTPTPTSTTTPPTPTPQPAEETLQWVWTQPMSTNRSEHQTVLLPNGQVLVVGGVSQTTSSHRLNSAELYEYDSGEFTPTGSMSEARSRHSATLLDDGRVLISGGLLSSAEVYEPSSGAFRTVGSMDSARHEHTATKLEDGRVLIVGGRSFDDQGRLHAFAQSELFSPTDEAFSITGSLVDQRSEHTATRLLDGRVLVLGGRNNLVLTGIPQIKPPFLDIAPAGKPPNIIPHSKGVKCGLMRPDSLKVPAFIGQPLYCQA